MHRTIIPPVTPVLSKSQAQTAMPFCPQMERSPLDQGTSRLSWRRRVLKPSPLPTRLPSPLPELRVRSLLPRRRPLQSLPALLRTAQSTRVTARPASYMKDALHNVAVLVGGARHVSQ